MEDKIIFTKIRSNGALETLCTFKKEIQFIKHEISLLKETIPEKDETIFLIGTNRKEIYMQAESMFAKKKWIADIKELIQIVATRKSSEPIYSDNESPVRSISSNSQFSECSENINCFTEENDPIMAKENDNSDTDDFEGRLYIVINDFNPNEKLNDFVGLRKGHIYQVRKPYTKLCQCVLNAGHFKYFKISEISE